MQVTQIEELSKSRSKVYIDREFAFVLYKGELRRYHIEEGTDISAETYHTIMKEVLPKRAKLRAMNLLKNREYTNAQLRTKLRQGFYPEEIVEEALEYVASFHYTDDLRYASQYISCNEMRRSRRRIEQDLKAKGIDEDTIRTAWDEWEAQGGAQDEEEMIRRLLKKRGYNPDTADYAERGKHAAFLMRKGFSTDKINKIMKEYSEDGAFF